MELAFPKKIAIIGQMQLDPKRFSLPEDDSRKKIFRDIYKWTHVEYKGDLVEEATFFSGNVVSSYKSIWEIPSFSTIFLGSEIRKAAPSVEITIINYIDQDNLEQIKDEMIQLGPEMIFLSTTFMLKLDQLVSSVKLLRSTLPKTTIVLGGHFIKKNFDPSTNTDFICKQLGPNIIIDLSMFGGENIIAILKKDIKAAGPEVFLIGNAASHKGEASAKKFDFCRTQIFYDNLPPETQIVPVRTSIGCPFKCSFCSYHETAGSFIQKDIDVILLELKQIEQKGIKNIIFIDDTLNFPKERFESLLDEMIDMGLTNFSCFSFCRCQYLTESICRKMKKCGFEAVLLGIESGSGSILKNMNKGATTTQYLKGISLLLEANILTFGAFIVGFPGETTDTLNETLDFINLSKLDFVYIQPYYYLHNSPIHRDRKQFNLIGDGALWKHATMTSTQCKSHLDELIFRVSGPEYAHLENTMWEYAYLRSIGFDRNFFISYRRLVNNLKKLQIIAPSNFEELLQEQIKDFQNNTTH